jgi:hypothetical protein
MALVSKGTYLNVTLADEAGNRSNMQYALDYATLGALSIGMADVLGIITDLEAVTDAQVVAYNVGETYAEDTDFYGAANSEVENVALISARIDGATPGKYASLRIPAPNIGIFQGTQGETKNLVDVTDADLRAYLANFEAAGHATVSDGENILDATVVGNFKGKRIHRGSRNG